MRATRLMLASALTVGIAAGIGARPATASVLYTVDGGSSGSYPGVHLQFETSTFISIPYTVTNPIECNGCTADAEILPYPSFPGVAVVSYLTSVAGYGLHFYVADFGNVGTHHDYYSSEDDTLSVSVVPEPASLALLTGGLLALAFARRRSSGRPNAL